VVNSVYLVRRRGPAALQAGSATESGGSGGFTGGRRAGGSSPGPSRINTVSDGKTGWYGIQTPYPGTFDDMERRIVKRWSRFSRDAVYPGEKKKRKKTRKAPPLGCRAAADTQRGFRRVTEGARVVRRRPADRFGRRRSASDRDHPGRKQAGRGSVSGNHRGGSTMRRPARPAEQRRSRGSTKRCSSRSPTLGTRRRPIAAGYPTAWVTR